MKALYQTTGEVVHSIACFVKNHDYLTAAQVTIQCSSRFSHQLIGKQVFPFFFFRNCNIHKVIEIRRQGVKLLMRMCERCFWNSLRHIKNDIIVFPLEKKTYTE